MAESKPLSTNIVQYAIPVRKPPHSVWSVVGLAVAILCGVPPTIIWWDIARMFFATRSPNSLEFISVDIGAAPLVPLIPICLCLIGLRRGRRGLAIIGIIISVVAMLAMGILVIKPEW